MRKTFVLLAALLFGLPAFGQQSVAEAAAKHRPANATALPADAPSRADVLKLFDLLQIRKTMDTVMMAAKQQGVSMVDQIMREKMPDATPEQVKQIHEMQDLVFNEVLSAASFNEMLDATVPIYQRHLTKSDLDAVVAFYSSPVGQKMLREQPAMVQESMQAMAPIQQRLMSQMMRKLEARVEKLASASSAPKQ